MRRASHAVFLALLAGLAMPATAQPMVADYGLTTPTLPLDAELAPPVPLLTLGLLQLGASSSDSGRGLSLQAGQQWFARAGIGHSFDTGLLSVGGGYRFEGGQALSMHVTRQLGQGRLGLAVRYDFSQAWLRLGYDLPSHGLRGADMLRLSAGMRF